MPGPSGRGAGLPLEEAPHRREENLGLERLLEERNRGPARRAAMKDVGGRIRRHVEHRYPRTIDREMPPKLPSIHPGHDDVGHYETEVRRQMRQVERLYAVSSFQRTVPSTPQQPEHQPAQVLLVLNDEDGDRALDQGIRIDHGAASAGWWGEEE